MPTPTTVDEFLEILLKSKLIDPAKLMAFQATHTQGFETPKDICKKLSEEGYLTPFHAEQLLRGKHRGFFLGKYKILDRIGLGGMGQVFLAEHTTMWRRVAIKVLPPERARNPYSRQRFLREARAAGQLDHPNLVRSFDFDGESEVMYLVMEYVDGVSFHDLVFRSGPLTPSRIGYYLWQVAHGLAYMNHYGLIHRDIKPANLLVDRQGVVKILDLGLVRTEEEQDALTRGEGVKMLGTADYFAPEQAIDCSKVDVRADLYSLGATGYFLATAKPPFEAEHLAQKLIAHQMKQVVPLTEVVPGFPQHLSDVIVKLLAKSPNDRFQSPAELIDALAIYATTPPALPTVEEIPINASLGNAGFLAPRSGSRNPGDSQQNTNGSSIRYHGDSKVTQPGEAAAATALATAEVIQAILPGQASTPSSLPFPLPPLAATAAHPSQTPQPKLPTAPRFQPPVLDPLMSHSRPAPKHEEPLIKPITLPKELRANVAPGQGSDIHVSAQSPATPGRNHRTPIALGIAFLLVFVLGVWVTLALSGPQTAAAPEAKLEAQAK